MSQFVRIDDLLVGVRQMIENGPSKWEVISSFGDSPNKGTTVDFEIVVFRDRTTLRVRFLSLEHVGQTGHQWNFVGIATVTPHDEIFKVRGFYNGQIRGGHVSRITI